MSSYEDFTRPKWLSSTLRAAGSVAVLLVALLSLSRSLLVSDIGSSNNVEKSAQGPGSSQGPGSDQGIPAIFPPIASSAQRIPKRYSADSGVQPAEYNEPASDSREYELLAYKIIDPSTVTSTPETTEADVEIDDNSEGFPAEQIDESRASSGAVLAADHFDDEPIGSGVALAPRILPETSHFVPTELLSADRQSDETATTEDSQDDRSTDQSAVDRFQSNHIYGDDWLLGTKSLDQQHAARKQRIRRTLDFYYARPLNSSEDSPWSMMHWLIAWGKDSKMYVGRPGGRLVYTLDWLGSNRLCEGARLLTMQDGDLRAKNGPGLQGHDGQFLAMLAQARVDMGETIQVGNQTFDINDLIHVEQLGCRARSELTFQLIGLSHYLDSDTTWQDKNGGDWSIPRLIKEEIVQPINGVTCGGTHRLMGLHYATRMRATEGKPVAGQWARARKYISGYQKYALSMQNRDGTFSSDFFKGQASWGDIDRKIKTTGHILELLIFSLPSERLRDPKIALGVDYLCNTMMRNRYYVWPKGPLSHAIRALSLYDERVYGVEPGPRDVKMAPASDMPRITAKPDTGKSLPNRFQPFRRRHR